MEFSLQYLRYIYIMDMSQLVTHNPRRIAKILNQLLASALHESASIILLFQHMFQHFVTVLMPFV
jgi:hypothetical protein